MPLPQPTPYLPNPMYLTLEEVRSSVTWGFLEGEQKGIDLSIAGPYSDQQILTLISQASRKIDGWIKDTLVLAVRFEEARGQDNNTLRLLHYPIWQGLQTTFTEAAHVGDTSISLAETMGIQPGKKLFTNPAESTVPTVSGDYKGNYWGGPGVVTLDKPLLLDHSINEVLNVYGLDLVQIVLPTSFYPITTESIVVQYSLGLIQNFTPLIFQRTGYNPIFTKDTPIQIQYTSGMDPYQYPPSLKEACLDIMTYQIAARLYAGVKKVKSGERTVEYEDALAKGIPPSACENLSQFRRGGGIY